MRFLAFSSLILLSTQVLAQGGAPIPEVEPNDTPAQAQSIGLGNEVNPANPAAGESNWYRFGSVGGQHRFTVNGGIDSRLELTNLAGTTILAGNDNSRENASGIVGSAF